MNEDMAIAQYYLGTAIDGIDNLNREMTSMELRKEMTLIEECILKAAIIVEAELNQKEASDE